MASGIPNFPPATRIYYGLHHPIQYNVKVKEIGYVPPAQIPFLISNWREEDEQDSKQDLSVMQSDEVPGKQRSDLEEQESETEEQESDLEEHEPDHKGDLIDSSYNNVSPSTGVDLVPVSNPRAFFKKGRVFMTLWAEPKGFSQETFVEMARFAVVKPNPTFSVCLRISTYSGQAMVWPLAIMPL
jgi:hypothetical protein